MFRGKHVLTAMTAALAAGVLAAGCSDPEPATPRVTFESDLEVGTHGTACGSSGPLFSIGSFGNPGLQEPVRPIEDGQRDQQGSVAISCAVTPAADGGFNVRATAQLTGATGGFFRVEGLFKADGAQGVSASFNNAAGDIKLNARDCTVTYEANDRVAAGRVWGTMVCPTAENVDQGKACLARAQFRFENCAQ